MNGNPGAIINRIQNILMILLRIMGDQGRMGKKYSP
jgi:hypothetical protein